MSRVLCGRFGSWLESKYAEAGKKLQEETCFEIIGDFLTRIGRLPIYNNIKAKRNPYETMYRSLLPRSSAVSLKTLYQCRNNGYTWLHRKWKVPSSNRLLHKFDIVHLLFPHRIESNRNRQKEEEEGGGKEKKRKEDSKSVFSYPAEAEKGERNSSICWNLASPILGSPGLTTKLFPITLTWGLWFVKMTGGRGGGSCLFPSAGVENNLKGLW